MLEFNQKVQISKIISNTFGMMLRESGSRILMYHSIGSSVDNDRHGIYSMKEDLFLSQMNWLANSVDLNKKRDIGGSEKSNEVILTFDDGFSDTHSVAAPIMLDLGIPFNVFVSPELIESNDKRYLNRSALIELSRLQGCKIGAHGYSHCRLTDCSEKKLKTELEKSKLWLEDLLSIPIDMMSYPHGSVDQRVRNAGQSAGYKTALTSKPGANFNKVDNLMLKRTDIWSIDDMKVFRQKVNGHWDWMRWVV
jgi:peptidoglycan/xylan/chitin deacetylase (PgdA/CDA1 family)